MAEQIKDGQGNNNYLVVNSDGSLNFKSADESLRIDDTSTTNVTYFGFAVIGANTSGAVWKIFKLDESSGTSKTYADSNSDYDNVWDNRTSLTYG